MKKIKKVIKKKIQVSTTTQNQDLINPSDQDFGGLAKEKSSSTETRKNVSADPNLIQGNRLEETPEK